MLSIRRLFGLKSDERGSAILEFALLAPAFMALMVGLFEVGVYMQNYNAVRSLAFDAGRFATVEYQKNNEISADTLESNIAAMGVQSPYNLQDERLTVTVTPVTPSRVDGAFEFTLDLSYDLPNFISSVGMDAITLNYSRPLFVIDNAGGAGGSSTSTSTSTSGG